MSDTNDLVALVGSRICHDLISPLGAIGNGLELLMLSGGEDSPEAALMRESLESASGRIRFFRIAFGTASGGQIVRADEITSALADAGRKAKMEWRVPGDCPRPETKLAFLLATCCESAMPFGGTITVSEAVGQWSVTGRAERMKIDDRDWGHLTGGGGALSPAKVHFGLVLPEVRAQGRSLGVEITDTRLHLTF
ncbi:histidine phosphotransferase family protein [Maritimibacter sp. DP1N21-5]|uniref:histidine phosphotransferase family protein n=1 Tax=Maritimibacter sp. DP1N21-5 TaxID=2836867 RepID=UPI001C45EEA8|nr:histidine phosphotransferase family protein [Maritimibacter sp. DP1N21-5]MBV7409541.1 histidine phosphotransferase [Maritimibacter sp. DP1N21-5]